VRPTTQPPSLWGMCVRVWASLAVGLCTRGVVVHHRYLRSTTTKGSTTGTPSYLPHVSPGGAYQSGWWGTILTGVYSKCTPKYLKGLRRNWVRTVMLSPLDLKACEARLWALEAVDRPPQSSLNSCYLLPFFVNIFLSLPHSDPAPRVFFILRAVMGHPASPSKFIPAHHLP
jgi:hypothetical protein